MRLYVVCHDLDSYEYFKRINPNIHHQFIVILVGEYYGLPKGFPSNTIVANTCKNNIEYRPTLLTFTAWYVLVFNDLIKTDYVGIFEYDCRISEKVFTLNHKMTINSIICFKRRELPDHLFLDYIPEFTDLLNSNLIDIATKQEYWYPTSNCIMSRQFITGFVMWYKRFVSKIIDIPNHPHIHERAISIYAYWKNYDIIYVPEHLRHYQKCSHNIKLRDKKEENNLDI